MAPSRQVAVTLAQTEFRDMGMVMDFVSVISDIIHKERFKSGSNLNSCLSFMCPYSG